MTETPIPWHTIAPIDALDIVLPRPDIAGPLNEAGEPCPWPWEPQQRGGAPMGQYHCSYCGAMVMAGLPHVDYADGDLGEIPSAPSPADAGGAWWDGI